MTMYAITGITGQVGGALAQALMAEGASVRAVVRDEQKGNVWATRGCEVAVAEMEDAKALTAAFRGAAAVFILPPPVFDPTPGYEEAWKVINAVVAALKATQPRKVVCLSTVGADASRDNLLSQRTLLEEALSRVSLPVTFLRAAWFLENAAWDVAPARESGVIHSFLMPLEKPFSMVSALDVGRVAAKLVQESGPGPRLVNLEGPRKVSPNDLAAAFARALGRPVRAEIVPRATWEQLFRSQGMKNPRPRIAMLDGFNEGWIAFPGDGINTVKGRVGVDEVVASLVSPLS
jgi:uncharacterized protein YbjT (DUF2867 family)